MRSKYWRKKWRMHKVCEKEKNEMIQNLTRACKQYRINVKKTKTMLTIGTKIKRATISLRNEKTKMFKLSVHWRLDKSEYEV